MIGQFFSVLVINLRKIGNNELNCGTSKITSEIFLKKTVVLIITLVNYFWNKKNVSPDFFSLMLAYRKDESSANIYSEFLRTESTLGLHQLIKFCLNKMKVMECSNIWKPSKTMFAVLKCFCTSIEHWTTIGSTKFFEIIWKTLIWEKFYRKTFTAKFSKTILFVLVSDLTFSKYSY